MTNIVLFPTGGRYTGYVHPEETSIGRGSLPYGYRLLIQLGLAAAGWFAAVWVISIIF